MFETKWDRWERAVSLWSHMERLTERFQWPIPAQVRAEFDALIASCRSALEAPLFEAAWAQGQLLSTDQAIEFARATLKPGTG